MIPREEILKQINRFYDMVESIDKQIEERKNILSKRLLETLNKQLNPEDFGLPQFGTKEQKTQGYICPQTKVQCNDEFCVSAEKCNLLPSTDVFSEPKQETLEEATENLTIDQIAWKWLDFEENYKSVEDTISFTKGVEVGIKWQQERSEEEVWNICNELASYFIGGDTFDLKEWFEQVKKK